LLYLNKDKIGNLYMKKILIAITLITATTMFALPPPKVSAPKKNTGPRIILRNDFFEPSIGGVSSSPNRQMANAVAISGAIATGLRMLQEATTPSQDMVIVIPEGTETPILIKEMEPVVTHPVPITILPMEIMKSK
jgi:hypothetical protein